jgi:multisubunit Na+/H+ antiporter MnhB subunit
LTEAAIGSGVSGAVMLTAVTRLRPTQPRAPEAYGPWIRIISAAAATLTSAGLAVLVLSPTSPAPTLAPLAAASLPELGVGNAITGILLAYRSVDTLLEKIVLLLALAGIWSLARDSAWGGKPAPPGGGRRDDTLRLLGQVLPPLGIVVGIYILWVGADAPGGAFQGGAILAAMWLLALMARLAEPPAIGWRKLRLAATIGPIVFLGIGFAGFALPGGFLSFPAGAAKPLIIAIEVALTFSIAVVLGLLVLGPPVRDTEQ